MAGAIEMISPDKIVEDLARVQESGIFIVDDVAFIQGKHGLAIGEAIAKKGSTRNLPGDAR